MACLNHVRMELFPPRTLRTWKDGFTAKKVFKCFSTLSLVNFSTDKKPQTSPNKKNKPIQKNLKKPHPMMKKTNPLSFFFFLSVWLTVEQRETINNKTITCKISWLSVVNNFARSFSRPEARPTVTWICRSVVKSGGYSKSPSGQQREPPWESLHLPGVLSHPCVSRQKQLCLLATPSHDQHKCQADE